MPKFSQLAVFIGKDYLVTIHYGELKPLVDMFANCKENAQLRGELLGKSSGFLLYKIIDALVDDLLHTLRRIIANLDEIEDDVFDENKSTPKKDLASEKGNYNTSKNSKPATKDSAGDIKKHPAILKPRRRSGHTL
jgi:Mg2+ and Co2+ transporter CorA